MGRVVIARSKYLEQLYRRMLGRGEERYLRLPILKGKGKGAALAEFFQGAQIEPDDHVLLLSETPDVQPIAEQLRNVHPNVALMAILSDDTGGLPGDVNGMRVLSLRALLSSRLEQENEYLDAWARLQSIRQHFQKVSSIGLLIQDDPDPDAIASALALRNLLGRNKTSCPIVTLGEVTRPENVAMVRILNIEVRSVSLADLRKFDALALVDVQPVRFNGELAPVDLVIDHHPEVPGPKASISDIRSNYGATSTILFEYLRAASCSISQRLATALLYGIKSDTFFLQRDTSERDVKAFAELYLMSNYNALRRMERPAIPVDDIRKLGLILRNVEVVDGVTVLSLGKIDREDLVPQVAEFGLQIEGTEWSVAAGLLRNRLVVSVRNTGFVKSAGDVVRNIAEDLGVGGGHRAAAKMILSAREVSKQFGRVNRETVRDMLLEKFRAALKTATEETK